VRTSFVGDSLSRADSDELITIVVSFQANLHCFASLTLMPNYTQAVTIISSLLLTFVFNLNSFSDKKDFQIRDTIADLVISPSVVDSAT
jgi:hypothetical protein